MWCVTSFMRRPANKALNSRIRIHKSGDQSPVADGILSSYCEVFHYLFRTNATDDVIGEADSGIWKFSQLDKQTDEQFQKALWREESRFGSF